MTRKFSLVLTLVTVGFLWAEIGSAEEGIVKNSIAPTTESIKLGTIFSLSGWGSEGGTPELMGVQLAVDEVNQAGGISGRQVELVVEDNNSDLAKTASAFRKLTSVDKVNATIGPNWAEFVEVIDPMTMSSKSVAISPSGNIARHRGTSSTSQPWMFTLWPDHRVAVRPLAEYIGKHKFRRLYAFVSESAYAIGMLEALESYSIEYGFQVVGEQRSSASERDFRAAILALRSRSDVDGVVDFLLEGGPSLAFLKQQYELKLNLPIFAFNSVPFDTELQQNLSWGNGMVYFDQILPGSPEFKDRFKARFGRSVGMSSAQAYDAVYIIKAAIERCLSAGKSDRGADLRDCVAATNYQGQSGKIDFGPSGAITSHADTTYLMQIKDGKIEPAAAKAE